MSVTIKQYLDTNKSLSSGSPLGDSTFFDGLGNYFTGNLDYQRQLDMLNREMSFNAAETQKQRDYAYQMDSSQYQRAVADLRKAGLNPYLAYNNGGNGVTAVTPAQVGSHSAGKSGQGFGALFSLLGAVLRGAVSANNAMLNANNAMQIAQIKDVTSRLNSEMSQTRYLYHFNRYNWKK